jgi:DNA-binding CsgD family transcriptional regulator
MNASRSRIVSPGGVPAIPPRYTSRGAARPRAATVRRDGRAELRALARTLERNRLARHAPAHPESEALALWQGLVAGRWTLVDQFDDEGRRYLIARRSGTQVQALRALTRREQQVVDRLRAGGSNKRIAYDLGLADSTVATHLANVMSKLGVGSRLELIRLLASLPGASPDGGEE